MAIIDAKRLEADREAEQRARQQAEEYANRHDSAWQQPPPAYEEAAGSSAGASSRQTLTESVMSGSETAPTILENDGVEDIEGQSSGRANGERRARSERSSRQDGNTDGNQSDSDESMPLLSNSQRRILKKRMRFKTKFRRILRMLGKMLVFTGLVLFVLWLFGLLGARSISTSPRPDPDHQDGDVIQDPDWSPPVKAPGETWPSPNTPILQSSTWFSFSTEHAVHFFHAKGSSYSGIVRYAIADEVEEEDWKQLHNGHLKDRIAVHVVAQFTHVELRDSVRVNKMRIEEIDAEGVGIYGGQLPNTDYSFVRFRVTVYLPAANRRSATGLGYDKTSWIPQLEAVTDNIRIAYETTLDLSEPDDYHGVSFGHVRFLNSNGGISLASTVMANHSISMKVINGYLRDIMFRRPRPFTVVAPAVNLAVINGPLMVSGVVGIDDVNLRTGSGGLNISTIATAKRVSASTVEGLLGGYYAGQDSVQIHAKSSDILVDVNVAKDIHETMVAKSGLLKLMGPEAPRLGRLANRWHHKHVDVHNDVGPIFVRYIDQSSDTKLNSTVKSATGSIDVVHSPNFQGDFEIRTTVGTISIPQPNDSDYLRRVFAVDRDERWRLGEKLVRGRTWSSRYDWKQGGDSQNAAFPISSSTIDGSVGAIKLGFE
jgi:hypothetical protein